MNAPLTPWNDPRSYAPNLEDQLGTIEHYEKVARHLRRLNRQEKWGRVVKGFCIAVAVFVVVWFGGQFLRVFL